MKMNCILSFAITFALAVFVPSQKCDSQTPDMPVTGNNSSSAEEEIIRKLEEKEKEAILNKDTILLSQLMSGKIIVHNPENTIAHYSDIMKRIRNGKINYSDFKREIERIYLVNGIAVVMGLETITPVHASDSLVKKRRFTNVWTKENGHWKLTARQATIIQK